MHYNVRFKTNDTANSLRGSQLGRPRVGGGGRRVPTVLGSLVPLSRSLENSKLNFTALPSLLPSLPSGIKLWQSSAPAVECPVSHKNAAAARETHVRVSVDVVSKVRTLSNEADVKTTLSRQRDMGKFVT